METVLANQRPTMLLDKLGESLVEVIYREYLGRDDKVYLQLAISGAKEFTDDAFRDTTEFWVRFLRSLKHIAYQQLYWYDRHIHENTYEIARVPTELHGNTWYAWNEQYPFTWLISAEALGKQILNVFKGKQISPLPSASILECLQIAGPDDAVRMDECWPQVRELFIIAHSRWHLTLWPTLRVLKLCSYYEMVIPNWEVVKTQLTTLSVFHVPAGACPSRRLSACQNILLQHDCVHGGTWIRWIFEHQADILTTFSLMLSSLIVTTPIPIFTHLHTLEIRANQLLEQWWPSLPSLRIVTVLWWKDITTVVRQWPTHLQSLSFRGIVRAQALNTTTGAMVDAFQCFSNFGQWIPWLPPRLTTFPIDTYIYDRRTRIII